jgi:hypothetical protein
MIHDDFTLSTSSSTGKKSLIISCKINETDKNLKLNSTGDLYERALLLLELSVVERIRVLGLEALMTQQAQNMQVYVFL